MPGPVVKKSTRFRDMVPRPLQGLYDYVADDPMGGLATTLTPPKGLIKALSGLHKSIPLGKEVAEEVMDVSRALREAEPMAQRAALFSRVTPHRLEHPTPTHIPKYASGKLEFAPGPTALPGPTTYTRRPQALTDQYMAQRAFEESAGLRLRAPANPMSGGRASKAMKQEMTRGVETPRVQQVEDVMHMAKRAPATETTTQKTLLRSTTQTRKASLGRGKLKEAQVQAIRALIDEGKSTTEVAQKFKLSPITVQEIAKRQSWVWVK